MNKIAEFTKRLKFVRRNDLLAVFPMLIGLFAAQFYKLFHRNIWLICERANEARDNGFWLFKYVRENHPEIEAVYAIKKTAYDYNKVAKYGHIIEFGSLKHWIYYFAASRNISSQKEGKPNAALCFILEVYLGMRKNRAYIRHGIAKDDQKWVYYDVTKMNLFVCSAQPEFDFVKAKFGYPDGNVKLLGLCRYDNLLTKHEIKKQILVMPTMREWLTHPSELTLELEKSLKIEDSEFFRTWKSLLSNPGLINFLEQNDYSLVFFLHASMQKYSRGFSSISNKIIIANAADFDVQQLLMESSALITDYSSIYFDFAYMDKPLAYYHFDYDKYRACHYQEGYFSYENDGFGPVYKEENPLVEWIKTTIINCCSNEAIYSDRSLKFFKYHDTNNCERTYQAIIQMR